MDNDDYEMVDPWDIFSTNDYDNGDDYERYEMSELEGEWDGEGDEEWS